MTFDNREAMAYMLFRRFGCSRNEALAAIDELSAQFTSVKKCAQRRWRAPRKRKPPVPNVLREGDA